MLEWEGGVDAAKLVLAGYDSQTRTWTHDVSGDFWEAVAAAHEQGASAAGVHVAVIDTGFDTSVPAIAEQRLAWRNPDGASLTHGTAVALLILEVAPDASLDLYPVGNAGPGVDENLLLRALHDVGATGADVLNLSMGEPASVSETSNDTATSSFTEWPDTAGGDRAFAWIEHLATFAWRDTFTAVPDTATSRALEQLIGAGVTIIAANGNDAEDVYFPARMPGVLAASHQRVNRGVDPATGVEVTQSDEPLGYSQSAFTDVAFVQPRHTLGSSFAAPLLTGFAALLPDRATLPVHVAANRPAGLASLLLPNVDAETTGNAQRRRQALVDLYVAALRAGPHNHRTVEDREGPPCWECGFLAAARYIDAGLLFLTLGMLEHAEQLLTAAAWFAPTNAAAAANLAVTFHTIGGRLRDQGNTQRWVENLVWAQASMARAVRLRTTTLPDGSTLSWPPYQERLAHIEADLVTAVDQYRAERAEARMPMAQVAPEGDSG